MKVLFVSRSNNKNRIGPIVWKQGDSLKLLGVSIDHFGIGRGGLRGYLSALRLMIRNLRVNKYDIIHAHYGLSALVAMLAKRKEKLVVSFMGDDIIGSNRSNGSVKRRSILLARINIFFSKWFYDYSIVKSEQMLKKMSHKNVTLIPNGVDINIFSPGDKTVARVRLAFDSQSKLAIFVSDPSREEKNYLLADKAVKLVKDRAILLLPVFKYDYESLPYYYNAADLLLLTSYHEGSPNVIKEAMACNCPIVSTDVGDVRWVLDHTKGCFISSYDPVDFSEKILLAIDFREKYGETNGRERIIELGLDSETIAKKIIEVYKKVLTTDN
jgi:glycosyltransferase involved in cell wall biosynthesis